MLIYLVVLSLYMHLTEGTPFIQEYIDEIIMKVNPELKNFLKESVYLNIE